MGHSGWRREMQGKSSADTNPTFMRDLKEILGFPGGAVVKNPPPNAIDTGDAGLIPELGRSPAKGNGNPLQYSCLENPMDRGTWQAVVHGVTKSWTLLSN